MMRKSLLLVLITLLMIGVVMVSCNSEVSGASSSGDKLIEVAITDTNTSKGISATGSQDDADQYYWYYKAVKDDSSVYVTGQRADWTPIKANSSENSTNFSAGLRGRSLGFFSEGDWKFSFRAYKERQTSFSDAGYAYSQTDLSVSVTNSGVEGEKTYVTVSVSSGSALTDAYLVFPTTGLNWKYSGSDETLSNLANKSAYMIVYYQTKDGETLGSLTELAKGTSGNSISSGEITFTSFFGKNGNSFDNNVTTIELPSSWEGTDYKLTFKVFIDNSNNENVDDQEVGVTYVTSVTAYKGGYINITQEGLVAVEKNEYLEEIIIDALYNTSSNTSKATVASTDSNDVTVTTSATAASSTSSTEDQEKKTSVTFPSGSLKTSATNSEDANYTDNYSQELTIKIATEDTVATTENTFVITESAGSVPEQTNTVAGINLILEEVTTVKNSDDEVVSVSDPRTITNFENNKIVRVTTYVEPHITDLDVYYNGSNKFMDGSTEKNYKVSYNDVTGELVIQTNHFSKFWVTGQKTNPVATLIVNGQKTKYYEIDYTATSTKTAVQLAFEAAADAVVDGSELVLNQSIEYNGSITYRPWIDWGTKNVKLNLNEKTLKCFGITSNGTLELTGNGTITGDDDSYSWIQMSKDSTLILNGVTISPSGQHSNIYVNTKGGGVDIDEFTHGGTASVIIKDGSVNSITVPQASGSAYGILVNSVNNLTITGGSEGTGILNITSPQGGIYMGGVDNATIEKCILHISGPSGSIIFYSNGSCNMIGQTLTGSTFSSDISELFVDSGYYTVLNNQDNLYHIEAIPSDITNVAEVYNSNNQLIGSYFNLNIAFLKAPEASTIKIIAENDFFNAITVSKSVTLDLNGITTTAFTNNVVNGTSQVAFMVEPGVSFTIKDSSNGALGKLSSAYGCVEVFGDLENAAIFTLESGNLTSAAGSCLSMESWYRTNDKLILSGGSVTLTSGNNAITSINGFLGGSGEREVIISGTTRVISCKEVFFMGEENTKWTIKDNAYIEDNRSNGLYVNEGTLNIEGGRISAKKTFQISSSGLLNCTGGTFNFDPTSCLTSGYVATQNNTDPVTWTVNAE